MAARVAATGSPRPWNDVRSVGPADPLADEGGRRNDEQPRLKRRVRQFCEATLYFWRINDLKRRLVQSPLSDREALPYLVAYTASAALVTLLPLENYNSWDRFAALCGVGLTILGPIWVYRQNGGNAGIHLLQRFLALGWVLLIRVLAFVLPILMVFYAVASATFKPVSGTDWYDVLIFTGIQLAFYHRLGRHVRDIAGTP